MSIPRGFTLMEVLVALVLLTLFTAVSYRSLDAVLDAQRQATAEMERWKALAAAFNRMDADLSNAVSRFDPKDPLRGGFHGWVAQDGGTQFDLVRLLPEDADQGAEKIGYRCMGGGLARLVWPDPDNLADAPRESTLLEGLRSCAFRYLDRDGLWRAVWQSQVAQPLPRAVELSLGEADGTLIRRVLRVQ